MHKVGIVNYTTPLESLKTAIDLAGGINELSGDSKVFIKPNFVVWYKGVPFPKYGVLTTARMIEDMVIILKEHGVNHITLIEGILNMENSNDALLKYAVKGMNLYSLVKRYGLNVIDVYESDFTNVHMDDVILSVNSDILSADYIIDMPVLKTHSQCKVSLGIKNLKGFLNTNSKKLFHNSDLKKNLDYYVAKLADLLAPALTVIDGIYSLKYGPLIYGKAQRSNLIVASKDLISADKVGATLLGHSPETVGHLALCAAANGRSTDLSDIDIQGDIDVNEVSKFHKYKREHSKTNDVPRAFDALGIKGIRFPQADSTLCTYCVPYYAYTLMGIIKSPSNKSPFDNIEILTGKNMLPDGTHKHTILLGQCQVMLNRKNPKIKNCVQIKGCPPEKTAFIDAFEQLGIKLPDNPIEWMNNLPSFLTTQYANKPKFEEDFYKLAIISG